MKCTLQIILLDHIEWRIRWEYVPSFQYPNSTVFGVVTYPQGEDIMYSDFIMKMGTEDTTGISYIHNNKGTFYLELSIANTESYTIIVEQDVNSIPEFPSWIILPIFLITTLVALTARKKLFHQVS